ncbi:MAG TPA: Gfo/Idh/MocA family oxidoreductase [Tepidisphaeraceae bacterium]|nr:Gfo/Idh/MocA family oxidoreductase [Tepidisphaeraceae bacterium]
MTTAKTSFTFAILGAGGRGGGFSAWIKQHPEAGKVVAVAEPDEGKRKAIADAHGIAPENQFTSWEALLAKPRLADVIINTLMDRLHAPSAIKALGLGYHMMLEKPMATTLEECIAIERAAREAKTVVSVCHSMRYHVTYAEVKRLILAGAIGDVISFDQLEPVDPIHQSHSFVRGNWANESRSTFMLMSKSCHDIDIVSYLVNRRCVRVSSFGSMTYFTEKYKPPGATLRCTDGCPAEPTCMYSALKIYGPEDSLWLPHSKLSRDRATRLEQLKATPWGKCVYQTDNDVVDHQVVAMEYEGGITGTFTMTAFATEGRYVRVHGTQGWLRASIDKNEIELVRFNDYAKQMIKIPPQSGGHGGADENVLDNLLHAMRMGDPAAVLTSPSESLETHRIVFAAERARREGRVVEISPM